MLVSCMNYWYIFSPGKTNTRRATWTLCFFLPQYDSGLCVCSTSDSNVQENPIRDSGLCGQMLVLRMNYWYILWPGKANTRTATWTFWSSDVNMILACASVLPLTAIHNNSLYMILACVAKGWSYAWIIGTLSGQERPTQEQLHGRSGLLTSIWFWLVHLFYQWQQCTRKPYTWFWLVWPNGGLMHELLVHFWPGKANTRRATWTFSSFYLYMILACAPVIPVTAIYKNSLYMILACVAKCWSHPWIIGIFLARKDEQKNSYMDSLLFLPQYDSGLCVCSTSDSNVQENPICDSGLCGQMQVFCMNYRYLFWPGKANTRRATWTFSSFYLNMVLACAPVLPVPAIYKNSLYMILACVAKCWSYGWIIVTFSGQERPTQEELHGLSAFYPNMILACASVLPVTAIHKNSLYMILACVAKRCSYAWIIGTFSGQERPTQEELHERSRLFTSIWFWLVRLFYQWQLYKNSLYMILACVAKWWSYAWIIGTLSGQERPTQEQLHVRSGLLMSIWFWLVHLFYQWQQCTRNPYTWFWLVWPNGCFMHKLLVHFLARKGQRKKGYMKVLVFLLQYDSGLCACSASDSYI